MDIPARFPQDELTELERRLAGWSPSAGALDRDRMLFEAGRASARSESRGRLAMVAGLAAMAVGLGGWAVRENVHRRALELALAERTRAPEVALVGRPRPPEPAPIAVDTPSPESYLALTRRLTTVGLDEPGSPPGPPARDSRPEGPDRSLTPLSARSPGDLLDL